MRFRDEVVFNQVFLLDTRPIKIAPSTRDDVKSFITQVVLALEIKGKIFKSWYEWRDVDHSIWFGKRLWEKGQTINYKKKKKKKRSEVME